MDRQEILQAIKVLTKVVAANTDNPKTHGIVDIANNKIIELIGLLKY